MVQTEEFIRTLYERSNRPLAKIVWYSSPLGIGLAHSVLDQRPSTHRLTVRLWDRPRAWDCLASALRQTGRADVPAETWVDVGIDPSPTAWRLLRRRLRTAVFSYIHAVEETVWLLPLDEVVLVCHPPIEQHFDERRNLHSSTGPAVRYPDGWAIWAWRNVVVPRRVIESPESLTAADVTTTRNAEVRRVMVERYGFDRYLRDGGFTLVQQDDFGRLYRKAVPGEMDMVFVKVVNSTPEPDGSFKEYHIPCRSHVRTAHQAVAESFGLTTATYKPDAES